LDFSISVFNFITLIIFHSEFHNESDFFKKTMPIVGQRWGLGEVSS